MRVHCHFFGLERMTIRNRLRETTTLTQVAARHFKFALRRFARDEDGVLIKPTIFTFLSMLAVGGIGIDLMRMERDRTELQYTLDRAVLAAADLDQTQPPSAVVLDYLTKSGLSEYYEAPVSDIRLGYRKVSSNISTDFEAQFLNFTGVGSIPIGAASTAEESIDGLEISLVLDVSGSMNSNSRLSNLKVAAKQFITEMVDNTTDGKMSISIIPYATQVSLPDELISQYNAVDPNGLDYSRCVNFQASDFLTTTLSSSSPLERTMHFSPWYTDDYRTSGRIIEEHAVCSPYSHREILPFQKDAVVLKNFIDNLWAWGNTSIDIGMKWGTTLLDDTAQPAIHALTTGASPTVPSEFSVRPSSYTDPDTLKIVVLMTDGQNTSQYYVKSPHRTGMSDVWYNASNRRYSTINNSTGNFWWDGYSGWGNTPNGGSDSVQLSNGELWARSTIKYVYYRLFRDWMGSSAAKSKYYYGVRGYHNTSTKDARTKSICDAAKAKGIIVYTIGFEAPSGGRAVLRDCASSDAHFFDVDGLEIKDAFSSIATSIRQLRLTQ